MKRPNYEKLENLVEVLEIKIKHKENELAVVQQQHEKTTAEYLKILKTVESKNQELKEAVGKASQMAQKAETASSAKGLFLANMSHELRTPMNGVIGFTDMLFDTSLDDEQIEYTRIIKSSGELLLSLIDDILDFSKIEAGQLKLETVDFDPEVVAYDICRLISPKVADKPIKVLCHIGSDVPAYVRGDLTRFRQVVLNFISNAAKFTESGEIEVTLDVDEQKDDKVKLCLAVQDTGIGISHDKLDTVFQVFQQADASTTRKYGGTGLGLPICKEIAKMMGGDVSVQSNPGKGSTFRFLAWFGKSERKQSERIVQATLSEKKVLIVVDNRNTLILLKHIMKSAGMRVVQLQRAQEVLPALRSAFEADDPFDLCILDTQMHCVSGYDIAGEIRHPNSGIPYVALLAFSCSTEGDDTKRCMEAGFDGFLHKPIDRKTLLNRVKKLLVQQKQPGRKEQAIVAEHTIREDVKHSVRILMAEDNPVNQKLTKMMLNKAGYQVDVANNVEKQ